MSELGSGPLVFVSYARADMEWQRRFAVMLEPEVRNRGRRLWSDALILTGRQWRPEITHAIERADVALLLVSPGFVASRFINEEELPALVAHGVALAPALLHECPYDTIDALASVQWAHDPRRDGPIAAADDVDGAIVRVITAVMAVLDDLDDRARDAGAPQAPEPGVRETPATALVASPREGAIDGVPGLPLDFVARDELGALRVALLDAGGPGLAITGGPGLGLHGQGGIGKTVLAVALARDPLVRSHFPDGVLWVTLGERPDIVAAQNDLLGRLGEPGGAIRTTLEGVQALRDALASRRALVVLDDVWTAAAAEAFDVVGPHGRVLYTTRDPATLRGVRVEVRHIDVLSDGAARRLLAAVARTAVGELPGDVDRILHATGKVTLALALVGAAAGRGGRDWGELADELERAAGTFLAHPYANVFKPLGLAVAALDPELAAAHATLAVYGEDARVPVAAVARLWSHLFDFSHAQTRESLELLAQRELLSMGADTIALHDLQRAFLLLHVESMSLLHHELLTAYRGLLPSPASRWSALSAAEPYIWDHLVEHLLGAGDVPAAAALTRDLGWVAIRAFTGGPHAAEADVRRIAALVPEDAAVAWVLNRLAQWGYLLAGHNAIGDVAATLALRTTRQPPGIDAGGLRALLPARALRPRWGLREAHEGLLRVLDNRSNAVLAVAYSPDGTLLASAGGDGIVQLWEPASGKRIANLVGHHLGVRAVAFSADARTLLSAGVIDGTVRLWDTSAHTQTAVLDVQRGFVREVAFSSDGRIFAIADNGPTIRLWDTRSATQTAVLDARGSALEFSRDGRVLASSDNYRSVTVWDLTASRRIVAFDDHASRLAFSPDGRILATAGVQDTVNLWDAATGAHLDAYTGHRGGVDVLGFSSDGRALACGGGGERMHLWDVAAGTQSAVFDCHRNGVGALAYSPDASTLATGGGDGTVRLWAGHPGSTRASSHDHDYQVDSLAASPDGKSVASAGDWTVKLWDAADGSHTVLRCPDAVDALAFSADGRAFASALGNGSLMIWDVAAGSRTVILRTRTPAPPAPGRNRDLFASTRLKSVAFSPDGRTLVTGGDDGAVRLWDVGRAVQTAVLDMRAVRVIAVAFSPDGRTVASAASGDGVRLSDVATGTQTGALERASHVSAVQFSPDGRILASVGGLGPVKLWDAITRTLVASLDAPSRGGMEVLAFSKDGRMLASGDRGGTLRLWDLATRTPTLAVRLGGPICALAFAGDRGFALGIDRAVAYLELVDRSEIATDASGR